MCGPDSEGLAEGAGRCSTAGLGEALAAWAMRTAAAECRWLAMLAEFDGREGWSRDGQLSAVDWLVWRCGVSHRTAREKLRVAHELRRRPVVAEAFAAGQLSYCKVRAVTRITDGDADLDRRRAPSRRSGAPPLVRALRVYGTGMTALVHPPHTSDIGTS